MREVSGFITLPNRGVYGTAFLPDRQAELAVVLVEPLGEEKRPGYRMFVRLGRTLAEKGVAAMRFDLSGTGDSTLPHEQTTATVWSEDLMAAMEEIKRLSGCRRLAMVAARGGALIAGQVAAADPKRLEQLVLVEPWFTGMDCLKDLERRQSIKTIMTGGAEKATPDQQWKQGQVVEFGGYGFQAKLAAELTDIRLDQLTAAGSGLKVSGIRVSPSKRLPPAWNCLGDQVTIVADKPFWGQLDYYESDLVIQEILAHLHVKA